MLTRYEKLPPGLLGKVQEQVEELFHVPVWYVFNGNLKIKKDLEEYTENILA